MGWDEALRLTKILRADPSSMIAAAEEGWDYPFTREAAILADLWNLEHAKSGAKKQAIYPVPWKAKAKSESWGKTGGRNRDQVEQILNAARSGALPQAPV